MKKTDEVSWLPNGLIRVLDRAEIAKNVPTLLREIQPGGRLYMKNKFSFMGTPRGYGWAYFQYLQRALNSSPTSITQRREK